jgi:hypothetical protein
VEFDDSEFDNSDMPDRFYETGPPDEDGHALARFPTFHSLWLALAVALVVGIAVGRLSAETHRAPLKVATDVATDQGNSASRPDCPPSDVCRRYDRRLPALLSHLIALDFPDTYATEFVVLNDSTNRLRELVLSARLGRGLVLDVTAINRPPRRSTMTPWVLVAVGVSHHPNHAARTMTSRRGDATIDLRVAVATTSVPERPGRADVLCTWCVRNAKRTERASRISGELDRAYPSLVAAVGDGVQAAARSHALARFILNPIP